MAMYSHIAMYGHTAMYSHIAVYSHIAMYSHIAIYSHIAVYSHIAMYSQAKQWNCWDAGYARRYVATCAHGYGMNGRTWPYMAIWPWHDIWPQEPRKCTQDEPILVKHRLR